MYAKHEQLTPAFEFRIATNIFVFTSIYNVSKSMTKSNEIDKRLKLQQQRNEEKKNSNRMHFMKNKLKLRNRKQNMQTYAP